MTRDFAAQYAAALLRGSGLHDSFEIAFPEQLDTAMVAEALEDLGCKIVWGRFRHYATVHVPKVSNEILETALLRKSG